MKANKLSKKILVSKAPSRSPMKGFDKGVKNGEAVQGYVVTGYDRRRSFSGVIKDGTSSLKLTSISVPTNQVAFLRVDTFLRKTGSAFNSGERKRSLKLVNDNGTLSLVSVGFASSQTTPFYVEVLTSGNNSFDFNLKPQLSGEDAVYEVYINWTFV